MLKNLPQDISTAIDIDNIIVFIRIYIPGNKVGSVIDEKRGREFGSRVCNMIRRDTTGLSVRVGLKRCWSGWRNLEALG